MSITLYRLMAECEFDAAAASQPPPPGSPPPDLAALGLRARCGPARERAEGCLFAGAARTAREPALLSYTVPQGGSMDFAASLCEQTGAKINDALRSSWCIDNGTLGPRCLKYMAALVKREQPIVLLPAELPITAACTRRDLVDLPQTSAFLPASAPGSVVGSLVMLMTGEPVDGRIFGVGVVKDRAFFNDVRFRTFRDRDMQLLVPVQLVTVFEDTVEVLDQRLAYMIRSLPAIVTQDDDMLHGALARPFGLWVSAPTLAAALADPYLVTTAGHPELEYSLVPQRVLTLVRMAIACPVFLRFLRTAGPAGAFIAGSLPSTSADGFFGVRVHVRKHTTARCLEHIAKRTTARDFSNQALCAAFDRLALP
jgi:hypothetical protein